MEVNPFSSEDEEEWLTFHDAQYTIVSHLLAKCIDFYTQQRVLEAEGKLPVGSKGIDPRLEGIVNRMFQRCLDDNQYRQALGLALETRRMDIFEAAIMQSVRNVILINYNLWKKNFRIS